jgi:hypothetical protein
MMIGNFDLVDEDSEAGSINDKVSPQDADEGEINFSGEKFELGNNLDIDNTKKGDKGEFVTHA